MSVLQGLFGVWVVVGVNEAIAPQSVAGTMELVVEIVEPVVEVVELAGAVELVVEVVVPVVEVVELLVWLLESLADPLYSALFRLSKQEPQLAQRDYYPSQEAEKRLLAILFAAEKERDVGLEHAERVS
nr:unnamed protein product [Haemonchus contortus]